MTFDGHEVRSENFVGPVRWYPPEVDGWNVCSFVAVHWAADRQIEEHDIRRAIELPQSMKEMGEHVAIVADGAAFLQAVEKQLEVIGLRYRHGLVEYEDEFVGVQSLKQGRVGFVKRRDGFSDQREFRILVERENPEQEALWVDVSELPTVAIPTTFDEFNEKVDLVRLE